MHVKALRSLASQVCSVASAELYARLLDKGGNESPRGGGYIAVLNKRAVLVKLDLLSDAFPEGERWAGECIVRAQALIKHKKEPHSQTRLKEWQGAVEGPDVITAVCGFSLQWNEYLAATAMVRVEQLSQEQLREVAETSNNTWLKAFLKSL